ncbi:uncharacterized protein LOC142355961, partial [Convolutriloba macropyga]|uniref:uncharacterized protein LOC142355961 n=1 Tax=Convolutriloba macropyga TaxID=536237 RepID=UPI003F51C3A2
MEDGERKEDRAEFVQPSVSINFSNEDEKDLHVESAHVTRCLYYPIYGDPLSSNTASPLLTSSRSTNQQNTAGGMGNFTSRNKYLTRVTLRQFEDAANAMYNCPIGWIMWLSQMDKRDVRKQM